MAKYGRKMLCQRQILKYVIRYFLYCTISILTYCHAVKQQSVTILHRGYGTRSRGPSFADVPMLSCGEIVKGMARVQFLRKDRRCEDVF